MKKKIKNIAEGSLICLLLILTISAQVALASSVPSDMNDILEIPGMSFGYSRNGIVRIEAGTVNEEGKFKLKTTCSGFIASSDSGNVYIVTTMHSVDYGEEGLVRVVVKNDTTVQATVEAENREKDFCILAVENKFNDKNAIPLRVSSYDAEDSKLAPGDAVSAIGFASEGTSTEYAASDVTVQEGSLVKTAEQNSGYATHDIDLAKGMGGGVLVDEEGYAIGLINTKKKGALDIAEVDTLLDKENLPHRTKDKDLMYGELYSRCAEAEAVVKRATKESKKEIIRVRSNALEVLQSEPYDRDSLTTALEDYDSVAAGAKMKTPKALILVILLGAVIIALAIRLIKLISWNKAHTAKASKGASDSSNAAEVQVRRKRRSGKRKRSAESAHPRLVVLRTGAVCDISNDRIVLGRSDECDLPIGDNSSIGRSHAGIERRGDAYYIFDLGSKNGTFLNNMQVDAEGIRLISGDIIRLAGEEIQFIQE